MKGHLNNNLNKTRKPFSYKNKIVLITGENRGIGKEISFEFANVEARVIVVGRNEKNGNTLVKNIRDFNPNIEFIKADISKKITLTV